MNVSRNKLTRELIDEKLIYNKAEGSFINKFSGKQSGYLHYGMNRITLFGTKYTTNELVYFYETGSFINSHEIIINIDGNKLNSKFENLYVMDKKPLELTNDILKLFLKYDKDTGKFYRKIATSNTMVGEEAGWLSKEGYTKIKLFGKSYYAHILAYFYVYNIFPNYNIGDEIDHKNQIRNDNSINNLRLVTKNENLVNNTKYSTNISGVSGVYYDKNRGWVAQIMVNSKNIRIGSFKEDKQKAILARQKAEKDYGFYKNHGKEKIQ